MIRGALVGNHAASRWTAGMLAVSVNPRPMRPVATRKSARLWVKDARAKPIASVTQPENMVQRVPTCLMVIAGSGLERPHVRQRRAKLAPAADIDQCSSAAIWYRTAPSE